MIEKEVVLTNRLGMHARAATKLVQVAQKYRSNIVIEANGMEADAKSILGLLTLAAPVGTKLKIKADGEDEKEAIEEIVALIEDKFGEGE
ncbi:MAG: HPr family phosphocarrier protein [Candidatus Aminicenantes bacterium]|nr:HPr family phosphocarrier protein [Candidatus Aminicenantes bacterium]